MKNLYFIILLGSSLVLYSVSTCLAQANWQQQVMRAEARYGKTSKKYVATLHNLFDQLYANGQYANAIKVEEEALKSEAFLYGTTSNSYIISMCNIASLSLLINVDMATHEQRIKEALPIIQKGKPGLLPSLYSILGNIYSKTERYPEAIDAFETGIKLGRNSQYVQEDALPSLLNSLGLLYCETGSMSRGGLRFIEALEIMERKQSRVREPVMYLTIKQNLAVSYSGVKKWAEGAQLLEQVAVGLRSLVGEDHPRYAPIIINLSYYYAQLNEYQKGLDMLIKYQKILDKQPAKDPLIYTALLSNIAEYHLKLKQTDLAAESSNKALKMAQSLVGQNNDTYLSTLENWCYTQWQRSNNKDVAEQIPVMGLAYLDRLFNLFTFSNESQRLRTIGELSNSFDFHKSFAIANPSYPALADIIYNEELALKGVGLNSNRELLTSVRQSDDPAVKNAFQDWMSLREELSKQQQLPLSKQSPNLNDLDSRIGELEEKLIGTSKVFQQFAKRQKINWTSVRDSLKAGEAAVEFISFELRKPTHWADSVQYAALVIRPGYSHPVLVPLCEERTVKRFLGSSSSTTSSARGGEIIGRPSQADSLYRLVWQPIDSLLQGAKTVFFSPSGLLHRVPFLALRNKKGLLGSRYSLRQVTSSQFVVNQGQPVCLPDKATLIGYGGMNYDKILLKPSDKSEPVFMNSDTIFTNAIRQFQELPGTASELDTIRRFLPQSSTFLTGDSGTEESLKSLSSQSPYILHIASHGYFVPAPPPEKLKKLQFPGEMNYQPANNPLLRSGLAMTGANSSWQSGQKPVSGEDGILTAEEISRMDFQKTSLVVLSACQTGLGDIRFSEGVFGLQRAFKQAGVSVLLMSLDRISDKETVDFMTEFYRALARHEEIHDAFTLTWKKLQKRYPTQPSRWSNFILVE